MHQSPALLFPQTGSRRIHCSVLSWLLVRWTQMKLWRDGSLIFIVKTLQRVQTRKEKNGSHLPQSLVYFKIRAILDRFFVIAFFDPQSGQGVELKIQEFLSQVKVVLFWQLAVVSLGSSEFYVSVMLVNSQLVCLLPVGIFDHVMVIYIICFH